MLMQLAKLKSDLGTYVSNHIWQNSKLQVDILTIYKAPKEPIWSVFNISHVV